MAPVYIEFVISWKNISSTSDLGYLFLTEHIFLFFLYIKPQISEKKNIETMHVNTFHYEYH